MKTAYDIIKHILRTEKGTNLLEQNKYIFKIDQRSNKMDVKSDIEEIYKVKVAAVNIINVSGKKKRMRLSEGRTADWKKAIVTLKPESKIEVT
ncbi:50S ribosomal protein L23 [Candidatus Omnitrophus magneticus]|uniref:Large ribosomal subunit protein uL23 n=1 Tax=Candidatus Omnitrophus magneticus TaxID=1609969 RepID=A0A0F0CM60_9BACT|nr:50S ribosomal protein L23 [Candidatus Omnitrophus magneticus]